MLSVNTICKQMSYTKYQVVNLFLILKTIHLNIKGIFFMYDVRMVGLLRLPLGSMDWLMVCPGGVL